jgi:mRNA interferase MazF
VVIKQGDIYWVELGEPTGSRPGYRHPHVVVQNNAFNESKINTVVVCALTSNIKLAKVPGNVLLARGEANLPKESMVNISQLVTVNKHDLQEKIGALPRRGVLQIIDGLKVLLEPMD